MNQIAANGNRELPRDWAQERVLKNAGRLSSKRYLVRGGAFVVVFLLAATALTVVFGSSILGNYAKSQAEQAFAKAYPGSVLRIGQLDYEMRANRFVAQTVTLSATNTMFKAGRISVVGVRWAALLWGTGGLADVLAQASIDATNLDLEFPRTHYVIRCTRLRASVPASELIAEGTELRTLVGDEEYFVANDFRTTRFQVVVPECRVLGLAYGELFAGKLYRARSIQLLRPSFDALVNLDKPVEPFAKSPLMVHEALAAIPQPLQVDSLSITDGSLRYGERLAPGAGPGVLTFTAVNLSAEGIANRGDASAAILLRARGSLMDMGTVNVLMSIPIMPADFSLRYSGSISAMDLTNLDAFLVIDGRTRIKSGTVKEATFDISVTGGQARGHVRTSYQNLEVALFDKQTGAENGLDNRVASFLANVLKIRSSNGTDASGVSKQGEVSYTRKPEENFQQFLWFALRTGVLDVISH